MADKNYKAKRPNDSGYIQDFRRRSLSLNHSDNSCDIRDGVNYMSVHDAYCGNVVNNYAMYDGIGHNDDCSGSSYNDPVCYVLFGSNRGADFECCFWCHDPGF